LKVLGREGNTQSLTCKVKQGHYVPQLTVNKLEIQTLEELKAEIAEDEAKDAITTEDSESTAETEELTATEDETKEKPEGATEAEESEAWMKGDEQGNAENDAPKTISVKAHAKFRHKLKEKLGDKDEEIAKLKQQLAESQSQQPTQTPAQSAGKESGMPRLADYDDDDKYQEAVSQWHMSQTRALIQRQAQQGQEEAQQRQQREFVDRGNTS